MGQKVNPHGLRVGVIKDWDSRWYASDEKVGDLIVEDQKIRKYLKKTLYGAGVPKIEIERSGDVVTVFLHCARPGMVIGKGGEQIEQYRLAVEKLVGKKVRLNIVEVRNPDMNAHQPTLFPPYLNPPFVLILLSHFSQPPQPQPVPLHPG